MNNNSIQEYLLERIINLPDSNKGLIVSCIFEKDLKRLNNQKRTVIDRLNFYIKHQYDGSKGYPVFKSHYNVKSRYYDHENTTERQNNFTFNNQEKYEIISDFSEYDNIRRKSYGKYPDIIQVINNGNQVLNWILRGHFESFNRHTAMIWRVDSPVVIDTIVAVDLNDYSKIEILYDYYTGKLNIVKKFIDKARYWSRVRLKAQEEYSPEKLRSQGYFNSDSGSTLTEDFSRLNINSFGKLEKYLLKLK
jgi:hypothetical protein